MLTVISVSGVLVPGGFGQRGTDGMMLAITYAREKGVPFLGICLGFQLAVIEWARYKLGMKSSCYRRDPYTPHIDSFLLLTLQMQAPRSSFQISRSQLLCLCLKFPKRIWVGRCVLGFARLSSSLERKRR
jgi:hypothetical protein